MIPKTIHYCWFGRGQKPKDALRCIASWKKFLPDYELKEWNEDNFDVNINPYVTEAYKAKKYAFVSDYARFWILYRYGGLYFDTDVEVIRPMNHIIADGQFMAIEKSAATESPRDGLQIGVNPGLGFGAEPGAKLLKQLLERYNTLDFRPEKDGTVVTITTGLLFAHGLRNSNEIQHVGEFTIYPTDYFCPMDHTTGITSITSRTVAIHHYSASWISHNTFGFRLHLFKNFCNRLLGVKFVNKIRSLSR